MAQAKSAAKTSPAKAPAKKASTAVVNYEDFENEAGAGMENADRDAFAIPFLAVLQKSSPQVDEDSGSYIKGAKAGMFYNNVTGELFDGKSGITIIPAAYQRRFVRWAPRDTGGGFKGEYNLEEVNAMRARGEVVMMENREYVVSKKGATPNPKKDDLIADTRNHFIVVINPKTGSASPAILALASTQIKKSRQLMTALSQLSWTLPNGKKVPPATYRVLVRATTTAEQNDKGSWHGVTFEVLSRTFEDRAPEDHAEIARTLHAQSENIKVTPPPSSSSSPGSDDAAEGF